MKKLLSFLLIVICILTFFTSCGYSNYIEGIENFSTLDSDVSLCGELIPTDFIEKFEYTDGNYHFSTSEKYPLMYACDRAIIYFQYDPENYPEAKEYALVELKVGENEFAEHNGYHFHMNESKFDATRFPHMFNCVAYNDANCTLVFIGFGVSVELHEEADIAITDWGAFLEKYFGEFYSFE